MDIPLTQIIPPRVLLRLVDREVVEYLELCDSLRDNGFLHPLLVRPSRLRPGFYEIINGLHRYSAAVDIGLESVPCTVRDVSDEEALVLALESNAVQRPTTPSEYAAHLRRLIRLNPDITLAGLSRIVHKSPRWITSTLLLSRLSEDEQKMVDRGEISLDSAYMLARTPRARRKELAQLAIALPTHAFKIIAAKAIREAREAARLGHLNSAFQAEFKPRSWLRSLKQVRQEAEREEKMIEILHAEGCDTMVDGWRAALKWVLHLDTKSIELQKALFESRQRGDT